MSSVPNFTSMTWGARCGGGSIGIRFGTRCPRRAIPSIQSGNYHFDAVALRSLMRKSWQCHKGASFGSDLRRDRDDLVVPFHAKLELLVRIVPVWVGGELGH